MNRRSPMTTAPIEIPSRGRSTSPACAPYPSASQTIPHSPDLLFEMSPVEVETEVRSSSFRSFAISVSRWNRDQFFSFPPKPTGTTVHHTFLPQHEAQHSKQAISSPKCSNSHSSSKDQRTNSESPRVGKSSTALIVTPPIIRTAAVHKISGFQPERSGEDLCSNVSRTLTGETTSRLPLAPSDSSLTTNLPWLLPGTKDGDDDDHYYLSQSPAFFDFKKFLLCRLEKSRPSAP
ncbi:hypothetical protein L218DRAFT_1074328 [Marasmius fiardii PR-910]|nr:hypothetical protein L218DRAFT_1074328 [Marasmius fiardii PR-910]